MNKIERIKNLVELLNKASNTYYNTDRPIISDLEFDKLYDELKQLEEETNFIMATSPTINVGFEVKSKLEKTEHSIPLLSLNKTKDINELDNFIGNNDVILMYKGDGLTHEFIYDNGELQQSSTRGNGYIGDINTLNAKTFKNIPLHIKFKGYLKLSGEAVIFDKDFEDINSQLPEEDKYSNSRNLVAGSVRQLNSKMCSERNVRFFSFSLLECKEKEFKTIEDQFNFLEDLGFAIINRIHLKHVNKDKLQEIIDILRNKAREEGFPIDGIVAAYNDLAYAHSLGNTEHHPLSKLAFKFEDEEYITKYIKTEWQVSRTSMINPVAIFDPIEIDGAVITRATLHNIDYFKALQLGKGDNIHIIRANMVIPKVVGNDTKSNTENIPDVCPICGVKTEVRLLKTANVLYCTNDNCPSKRIAQIEHYCSRNAMNIVGLSEATIEKFIEKGFLKDLPDIYKLEQYKNEIINMEGFGQKSYIKLIESINKSKQCSLANFIFALGIPNVGKSTAKDLVEFLEGNTSDEKLLNLNFLTVDKLLEMKDCGEITAKSIVDWITNQDNKDIANEILDYITFKEEKKIEISESKDNPLKGKTIYPTGVFKLKKSELKVKLEQLGAIVSGGYKKSLDYLICGGDTSKSGKVQKAINDGVKLMTEDEIMQYIK